MIQPLSNSVQISPNKYIAIEKGGQSRNLGNKGIKPKVHTDERLFDNSLINMIKNNPQNDKSEKTI